MTITHEKETPCLECALGNIGDNPNQTCEILGVHPGVLQLATAIQVSETIRVLLDQKPLLEGKMLYIDLETLDFDKISFKRRNNCRICGSEEKGHLDKGKTGEITRGDREIGRFGSAIVTSLCGKDTLIIDPTWEINWNFEEIKMKLKRKYYFAVEGKNYATFIDQGINISLLSSGVTTIRGAKSSSNAVRAFKSVLEYIYSE
ncbi:MAG: ThiF family adenylyltransferase, partial [Candidatus Kariarchaeaceae archaeon]|jgi:hypothetical protein